MLRALVTICSEVMHTARMTRKIQMYDHNLTWQAVTSKALQECFGIDSSPILDFQAYVAVACWVSCLK